jgi:hypothetical protein
MNSLILAPNNESQTSSKIFLKNQKKKTDQQNQKPDRKQETKRIRKHRTSPEKPSHENQKKLVVGKTEKRLMSQPRLWMHAG